MTLNVYTDRIENGSELWVDAEEGGKRLDGITWVMALTSIPIGMPRLTQQNKVEYLRRIRVMEDIYGALMNEGPKPILFTEEDIERRIGLRTNSSPLTKQEFDTKFKKIREREEREKVRVAAYADKEKTL